MQIQLPQDLQPFVEQEFSTGIYASREEIVIQALIWLRDERLRAIEGIKDGLADMWANRSQPITDAFSELKREFGVDE